MRTHVRLGLALALGGVTIVLDTTIAVLAMPVLVGALHEPLATVQWVSTAYVLALVASTPFAAYLGARLGRRRTYVAALVVFAAASAAAGLAPGAGVLIAARAVQGLGGGLVNPLGLTIGLTRVPPEHRGRIAALLGLPVLIGPLVGPVLAGWLVDTVSWRAIFFVTVPPALLAVAAVLRLAPADDPTGDPVGPGSERARPRLDVLGTALLVPGAVALVFGVGQATAPAAVRTLLAVAGLGLVAAFVRRSWRHPHPLLEVRLLRDPAFGSVVLALVLFTAAYFGSMLLTPTYVQLTRGAGALVAGTLGIPAGLATGLSLQVATRLVDRVPPARVVAAGFTVAIGAVAAGILVLRADTPFWVLGLLGALVGLGSGAVLMPAMTAATRLLRGDDLASGSSILTLAQQVANAVGTATISAVLAGLVAWRAPGLDGGVEGLARLGPAARAAVVPDLVTAQRLTQLTTLGLMALGLLVVLVTGLGSRSRPAAVTEPRATPVGVR